MDGDLTAIVLSAKKPGSEDYILWDTIYMTFWVKQRWEQISGCQDLGVKAGFDCTKSHLLVNAKCEYLYPSFSCGHVWM